MRIILNGYNLQQGKLLTLLAACLIASSHCASHDVEWIYGMTENELCVAPGTRR